MAVTRNLPPIKQGDTKRRFRDKLYYEGALINLSSATVKLAIKNILSGAVFLRDATTKDASGNVTYQFVEEDVETAGKYDLEWQITFDDERELTIPQDVQYRMEILARISE